MSGEAKPRTADVFVGTPVRLLRHSSVLQRFPQLVGAEGVVSVCPTYPNTWFKIRVVDGPQAGREISAQTKAFIAINGDSTPASDASGPGQQSSTAVGDSAAAAATPAKPDAGRSKSFYQPGTRVRVNSTASTLSRCPSLIGVVGTVRVTPAPPNTWYRVEFPAEAHATVTTFRSGDLKLAGAPVAPSAGANGVEAQPSTTAANGEDTSKPREDPPALRKGVRVLIQHSDGTLSRIPHMIGREGVIVDVPVPPSTWYKVSLGGRTPIKVQADGLAIIESSSALGPPPPRARKQPSWVDNGQPKPVAPQRDPAAPSPAASATSVSQGDDSEPSEKPTALDGADSVDSVAAAAPSFKPLLLSNSDPGGWQDAIVQVSTNKKGVRTQATVVRLGGSTVQVRLPSGRVISKRPQDLYLVTPGNASPATLASRDGAASEASNTAADDASVADDDAASTTSRRRRRRSSTSSAQPALDAPSPAKSPHKARARKRGSGKSSSISWLGKRVVLHTGEEGVVASSGHGFYHIKFGDAMILKRVHEFSLAEGQDTETDLPPPADRRPASRLRHPKRTGGAEASVNANGGSSNRRPRRPRDATRPPSRRSTRETAGRPPDYDRSAQDDDRSKDTPAEREREPAPRRSAWNARPLVLGEIIPPGTADRVRGYLERIAEKEDFVYRSNITAFRALLQRDDAVCYNGSRARARPRTRFHAIGSYSAARDADVMSRRHWSYANVTGTYKRRRLVAPRDRVAMSDLPEDDVVRGGVIVPADSDESDAGEDTVLLVPMKVCPVCQLEKEEEGLCWNIGCPACPLLDPEYVGRGGVPQRSTTGDDDEPMAAAGCDTGDDGNELPPMTEHDILMRFRMAAPVMRVGKRNPHHREVYAPPEAADAGANAADSKPTTLRRRNPRRSASPGQGLGQLDAAVAALRGSPGPSSDGEESMRSATSDSGDSEDDSSSRGSVPEPAPRARRSPSPAATPDVAALMQLVQGAAGMGTSAAVPDDLLPQRSLSASSNRSAQRGRRAFRGGRRAGRGRRYDRSASRSASSHRSAATVLESPGEASAPSPAVAATDAATDAATGVAPAQQAAHSREPAAQEFAPRTSTAATATAAGAESAAGAAATAPTSHGMSFMEQPRPSMMSQEMMAAASNAYMAQMLSNGMPFGAASNGFGFMPSSAAGLVMPGLFQGGWGGHVGNGGDLSAWAGANASNVQRLAAALHGHSAASTAMSVGMPTSSAAASSHAQGSHTTTATTVTDRSPSRGPIRHRRPMPGLPAAGSGAGNESHDGASRALLYHPGLGSRATGGAVGTSQPGTATSPPRARAMVVPMSLDTAGASSAGPAVSVQAGRAVAVRPPAAHSTRTEVSSVFQASNGEPRRPQVAADGADQA